MTSNHKIDVCICTFRRPELAGALSSLFAQVRDTPQFRIIVADNDDTDTARPIVRRFVDRGIEMLYVHAPARNISIARNACLNEAVAEYVAFIDDDQIAAPDWLKNLCEKERRSGAAIVLGPVVARYPSDAPKWLVIGDFHSTYPTIMRDQIIRTGYTGNVLMRREEIGDLRFDNRLGRCGGEDTLFFHQMVQNGSQIVYAPEAGMSEIIGQSRLKLSWLLKRAFRAGQTHGRILVNENRWTPATLPVACLKFGFCLLSALATAYSATRWRHALVRGGLHAGTMWSAFSKREIELY